MRVHNNFIILLLAVTINCSAETDKVVILYSDVMLQHNTGANHPEQSSRLSSAINAVKKNKNIAKHLIWPKIKTATDANIQLAHTNEYISLVKSEVSRLEENQHVFLSTGDVVISKDSDKAARIAVGAGITAADYIMDEKDISSAFALVRPPGHHASANKGMGFCIYNNIAITAKYLQEHHGLERILIVDYDVHHGNGTQDIFYNDGSVFYFSVHQHPLYPGTGSPIEIGQGAGEGSTLNVELAPGANDESLIGAVKKKLLPAMKKFNPEFVLVSSGFDGHKDDQLGGLSYTSEGYRSVAAILKNLANTYADGRIVFMLEGGYTQSGTNESIVAILEALTQNTTD